MLTAIQAVLCMSLSAAPAAATCAQDAAGHSSMELARSDYRSLAEFMDAEVVLQADLEARREAVEEGERAERPRADVVDLVLTQDGEIRLVALSVGGMLGIGDRIVLVPSSRLYPALLADDDDDKLTCSLHMTEQELKTLPEFDADSAKEDGHLVATVALVEASFPRTGSGHANKSKPDDKSKSDKVREQEASVPETSFALATDLMDLEVAAIDGDFGEISDAAVDLRHHCIDYLLVSHGETLGMGGDVFIVPMAAAQLTDKTPGKQDSECVIKLAKTVAQLESCAKYQQPQDGDPFLAPEHCKLANTCFGTKPRAHDQGHSQSKSDSKNPK